MRRVATEMTRPADPDNLGDSAGSRLQRRGPPIRPRFPAMHSQLGFRFVFIAAIEVGWHNTAIVLGSQGHVVITDRPNHIHFD